MASASRSRNVAASQQEVWALIADADHMPRWWPGVARVEGVSEDHFTQVFKTKKGRSVRLDFQVVESDPPWRRSWQQEISGTPFERVLNQSIVSIELKAAGAGTEVTLIQEQKLRGYSRTGGFMLRRATRGKLDEALDGLERLFGP
ncbi:MAG: SRPBCC family protein [Solirubrobacteraceae bacterium]